jgi:hypothetical protein
VGELAVAVVAGWAMGRLSVFRTVNGVVSSRLRAGGAAVFLGFVAVRVLVALLATTIGGTAALLSASVLIMIAVVKLAQGLVVAGRYRHHLAQAPTAPAATEASVRQPSYR